MHLFDINLLLALLDPEHANHLRATQWAIGRSEPAWATCELTVTGFVRVLGNPKATKNPRPADEAWKILSANFHSAHHTHIGLKHSDLPGTGRHLSRCQGHNQVTDALLIRIAHANHAKLATFDARLRHLSPDPDLVEVIPTS